MGLEELLIKDLKYWLKITSTSTEVPSTHTPEYVCSYPACGNNTDMNKGLPRRNDIDWYLSH
jgi:hypothetical protein